MKKIKIKTLSFMSSLILILLSACTSKSSSPNNTSRISNPPSQNSNTSTSPNETSSDNTPSNTNNISTSGKNPKSTTKSPRPTTTRIQRKTAQPQPTNSFGVQPAYMPMTPNTNIKPSPTPSKTDDFGPQARYMPVPN